MFKIIRSKEQRKAAVVAKTSDINVDDLMNNTRRQASRQLRKETREYITDKINELATESKKIM
jgi:hypothetical protein